MGKTDYRVHKSYIKQKEETMAFQNRNFSVIAYCNGFTYWHYSTKETGEEVLVDTYFQPVHTLMNKGDVIIICAADGVYQRYIEEIKEGKVVLGVLK